MKHMTHLMEERHNVIVPHQRRFLGRRFGKVGNHGCDRIISLAIREVIARQERPDRGMGVFGC